MASPVRKPEVLAPAGSPEALAAALAAGADAVYFGLQDGFNARARAANFELAELPATVARIHRAGARAYVTLNTLVFEPELPAMEHVLRQIAAAGVDALIVQDPAVCLLARTICPELELHGSTQMTIASPAAAAFAAALGVTRVVVPRELSVAEIERFAAGTPLEVEVFIHGALCVSWSGQCLTSEAWGGRSANRGQCAQSCRMPYEFVVDGKTHALGDVQYLLSPKDLAGVRAVPELLRIGVHGLKIEGRQKGPQYVATSTAGYRRWVDALATGGDRKAAERQLAQDLLAMSLSYTRGFSDGFLAGSDHQTLVEGRFPKHRGVYVGRVAVVLGDSVTVRVDESGRPWTGGLGQGRAAAPQGEVASPLPTQVGPAPLQVRPGMGIVFDQGNPEQKNEPGGPVFFVESRGNELRLTFGNPGPDLSRVRTGDRVWVTSDPALATAADKTVRGDEPEGRNPLALHVRGAAGEPLQVTARHGRHEATVHSATPLQPARGTGLDAALLADKLGAFGGTPFALAALDTEGLAPGLHVPASELKELRRRLVAELLPALERGPERTVRAEPAMPAVRLQLAEVDANRPAPPALQLVPLVRHDAQLEAVIALGLPEVELDWMEFTGLGKAVDRARAAGLSVTIATPRIGKPGEEAIDDRILRLSPDGILVRHLGALMTFLQARERGLSALLHGDFSLNVTNSLTARHLLGLGLDTVTASFDLDEAQLLAMLAHVPAARLAVVAHHRIPTFHTEHCIYAHLLSSGRDFRSCGRPCERHQVAVQDHQGRQHPVIVDVGCRNTVFHHEPQQSAAWAGRLRSAGVRRFRVEFVRESQEQVTTVLRAWRELLAGRLDAASLATRTGAHSQFGVAQGGMKLLAE
ncbi:MAG: U32 family peptidase [Planctomycetes bacterium]|nr:U32 family peptidase [Planctomycetota bacterium]